DDGQKALRKRTESNIPTSTANKRLRTTTLNWFNVAQLALQTSEPDILKRPPTGPIRLGSYFTGYSTDSLALNYLGLNHQVAFVTENNSVKDTLRISIVKQEVAHQNPIATYFDVRHRSTKDVPCCDVFVAGPPCAIFVIP
ncbi:MAG: hypothetical protein ACKPKO_29740, partial [Candidatus Fonsibacter sp.]